MTATLGATPLATPAQAAGGCTYYAAPGGSDSAPGSIDQPFAGVQRLVDALAPGQTGCLRAGTYSGNVKVSHGGGAGDPVTLTAYPGEQARVVGRLWIAQGADHVTVSNLALDGINSNRDPSPTINANYATFSNDDVTNEHTEICFLIGNSWGAAAHTILSQDRIHDCGKLPAQNGDHGIYVELATSTLIVGNVIYDNADRGIQLYPNAQGTTITGNVIDGNGEGIIFSGDNGTASNGTIVRDNVISNSIVRHNVESWYPGGNPVGQGNVVSDNCLFASNAEPYYDTNGGVGDQVGFTVGTNVIADPQFVDRADGDLRVQPSSRCAALLIAGGAPATEVVGDSPSGPAGGPAAPTAVPPGTPQPTSGGYPQPVAHVAVHRRRRHVARRSPAFRRAQRERNARRVRSSRSHAGVARNLLTGGETLSLNVSVPSLW